MAFGDILIQYSEPGYYPGDAGGNSSVCWAVRDAYVDHVMERSVIDLSLVRVAAVLKPYSVGGKSDVIWYAAYDGVKEAVCELSVVDFSVVRSATAPEGQSSTGSGGDTSVFWLSMYALTRVYELSVVDFSAVRFATSPGTTPYGIGGTTSYIWHADGEVTLYELSEVDFSVVRFRDVSGVRGAGGSATEIWSCSLSLSVYWKLDSEVVVETPYKAPVGSPTDWIWDYVDYEGVELTPRGSPTDWVWEAPVSGGPLLTMQGSPTDWVWGTE